MKAFILLVGLGICLIQPISSARAAQTVSMRLTSTSLRFEPASAVGATSLSMWSNADMDNGEVFSLGGAYSHATGFILGMPGFPLAGVLQLDIPGFVDENSNDFHDFFEVSQAVPESVTAGEWETGGGFDTGTATFRWTRPAGSAFGTCRVVMESDTFGQFTEFVHNFELIEYAGEFEYGLERPGFGGTFFLARNEGAQHVRGELQLERIEADGELFVEILGGTVRTQAGDELVVDEGWVEPVEEGSQFGILFLLDGNPSTVDVDYETWFVLLDEVPDEDADGVADFFDGEILQIELVPPGVVIRRVAGDLELEITGQGGVFYTIERSPVMPALAWESSDPVVSTGERTVVKLPQGSGDGFFRVRVGLE